MRNSHLLFLMILTTFSCSKEDIDLNDNIEVFELENFKMKELGVYAELGIYYDGLTKMILRQDPSVSDQKAVYGEIVNLYSKDPLSKLENVGDFYIETIKSVFDENRKSYIVEGYNNSLELGEKIQSILGNKTVFKLEKEGVVIFEKELYVPKELEISFNNNGKQEYTPRYFIDRNKFHVEWNKDEKNTNQILVIVSWRGDFTDTSLGNINKENNQIYNALLLDETGQAIIPTKLFQGIPENAVVTITFMRGEITSVIGNDNVNYQIQALSEVQFRLALN